jgi:hypothetical protein
MKLATIALAALVVLGLGREARAQQFTLTVSPASFTFPSNDPDLVPIIAADQPVDIGYKAAGMGKNGAWHLSIRANTDLVSGGDSISVTNISWTAGAPLASGTALTTSDQTLYSSIGNMTAIQHSLLTFSLANSWTYKVGNYSTTIVFTLSAP